MVPLVPPPPGLLTTATGWPKCLAATCAHTRATRSVRPPAFHVTINRIGFSGYAACVSGAPMTYPATATKTNTHPNRFFAIMVFSSVLRPAQAENPKGSTLDRQGHGKTSARRRTGRCKGA